MIIVLIITRKLIRFDTNMELFFQIKYKLLTVFRIITIKFYRKEKYFDI